MESDLGKLFIGGISWDTNEDRLKEYFETFGEVVEAVIMKDRTTGRARGFGFVVFADPVVAERVVMEKHQIDGRTVEAKKAVPRDDQHILSRSSGSIHGSPGPTRTKKIFVGGLASTVTESDFKNYFDQFGIITDVVVMYDHNTQRPRGFGFITFDAEEAVEKVLLKTFHELNGKMVEVKRAVPKELSPGPSRNPLGGYNYGSRMNSLLNGYTHGFNPNSIGGGYGVRMDGRFSPIAGSSRGGYPPFGPPNYGIGMNFEPGLSPSFGGGTNFNNSLGLARGLGPFYNGSMNRISSPIGYSGNNGGNNSLFSSPGRNLWSNSELNYANNSPSSNAYMNSGSGTIGGGLAFGNTGLSWNSSLISSQGRGGGSGYHSGNLGYGSNENNFGLGGAGGGVGGGGGGGYGRNGGNSVGATPSFPTSNGGFDAGYGDLYSSGSVYGDSTWRSATSELDVPSSFGYGLGNTDSDVTAKSSVNYVGGYGVSNRQPNRGSGSATNLLREGVKPHADDLRYDLVKMISSP